MEEQEAILDEISCDEVQQMLDQMLGENSFSFLEYVEKLMQGKMPFGLNSILHTLLNALAAGIAQERNWYISLVLIGVIGAVLGNFSHLLQGKQVAETAFYVVYMLFFSVLLTAFTQIVLIGQNTLEALFDFMKALCPAFFMTMAFSQGSVATGAYYEFTLVMITLVDLVLVKFVLPGIQIYFMLQVANQFSDRDMFSKMAELIRDVVKFVMKTMFGLMMGLQVVQGLVLPVTSKLETSAVVKMTSAIPGIGNTISSVTNTVLCAGTLVKNAVGAVGVIAVACYCGVPLIRLVIHRFLLQLTGALIQPVTDRRIVACITTAAEAVKLLAYAVFIGCMMFVVSIALISVMTSLGGS